jgi:hypothetical protein
VTCCPAVVCLQTMRGGITLRSFFALIDMDLHAVAVVSMTRFWHDITDQCPAVHCTAMSREGLRLQTSDAREPAPYEMLRAARYLSPSLGVAAITSDTSSMLRTVGSLRGCVRNYMYRFILSYE